MRFIGQAKTLSGTDISLIAGYLGCEIAMVHAVLAVESRGHGFDGKNRPIILNEPHWFYRNLSGAKRDLAVKKGLAYEKWGEKPYPRTQDARYQWLRDAMEIDEEAALKSCSWGLGQLMGFNYEACGFKSVFEFVDAMKFSEGAQLLAMARFMVSKRLQIKLKDKDFAGFAAGYNGSGYKKNKYDTKLAFAYRSRPRSEKHVPPATTMGQLDDMTRADIPQQAPKPVKPNGASKATGGAVAAAATAAVIHYFGLPIWALVPAAVAGGIIVYLAIHYLSKKD